MGINPASFTTNSIPSQGGYGPGASAGFRNGLDFESMSSTLAQQLSSSNLKSHTDNAFVLAKAAEEKGSITDPTFGTFKVSTQEATKKAGRQITLELSNPNYDTLEVIAQTLGLNLKHPRILKAVNPQIVLKLEESSTGGSPKVTIAATKAGLSKSLFQRELTSQQLQYLAGKAGDKLSPMLAQALPPTCSLAASSSAITQQFTTVSALSC